MEDAYARFEPNPLKIRAWRARLSLQRAADQDTTSPAELYARAVPTTPSHAIARLCSRPGVSPLHAPLSFRSEMEPQPAREHPLHPEI